MANAVLGKLWQSCLGTRVAKQIKLSRFSSTLTSVKYENGVRRIQLTNPKQRNALSLEMLQQLKEDLLKDVENESLRCIVLSGEGKVFSSGHNLKELTDKTGSAYHESVFSECTKLMTCIQQIPVPVIAQVSGVAAAAGCQLVASCDIVIASESSKFSTPGANVGLFCSTPGIAVARAVPRKVSALMLLAGDPISAQDALRSGLVSKVVPSEDLEQETEKVVASIVSKSRAVLEFGKLFYYRQMQLPMDQAYREGEKVMVKNLTFDDAREGINAFIDKRRPTWSHK